MYVYEVRQARVVLAGDCYQPLEKFSLAYIGCMYRRRAITLIELHTVYTILVVISEHHFAYIFRLDQSRLSDKI